MKKLFLVAGLMVGVLSACGGNPCNDLKAKCDACTGTAGKAGGQAGCNAVVALGVAQTCQAALDTKAYDATGPVCK
jgi:hypothetical protein